MRWELLADPIAACGAVAGLFLFLGAAEYVFSQLLEAREQHRLRRLYRRGSAR